MEFFILHAGLGLLGHFMVNGYFKNYMKNRGTSAFDNGVNTFLACGAGILALISSVIFLYRKRQITGKFWWGLSITG